MATFSYADAVKLLGGNESKIVNALDKLVGGALLTGTGLGFTGLLGWFDAKADFIRLSHELVAKVSGRKMTRYDRTHRLHAAHTVIVFVAFFEAFDELKLRLKVKHLDLTTRRQLDLRKEAVPFGSVFEADVPLPSPGQPFEQHLTRLGDWYHALGNDLIALITRLDVWDGMDETQQDRLVQMVSEQLDAQALLRYQELFRQLAAEFPEVAFWWQLQDSQATRAVVTTALNRLEEMLAGISIGDSPSQRRAELAAKYRSVLRQPIIESDQAPDGLSIPPLSSSYIDPRFQVCEAGPGATFALTSWWESRLIRHDLHRFLAGYLTSPKATTLPMLVLGDPGSGKSVLTKVLAAQLPASDFVALRVELRTTPTEADVLQQIEHGLREALQEQVNWPALTRSAGAALPVVLLDGFDELLQATGVSQTDYLTRIARFQRDSADVGRPVAVVVTSRISVADRTIAPEGTVVLRLVPFYEGQIEQWLEVWNRLNARYFEAAGLEPLSSTTMLRYQELSEQPLLLLMLALYDADGNALLTTSKRIRKAELYEQLLTRFARREVVKDGTHRTNEQEAAAVERELERLSIVAFAMFNRNAQWVTEEDLDLDLAALLDGPAATAGTRAPLGKAETALGRFFFVQRAQATRNDRALRTYEFLHATFGEFLVARSAWRILLDLVEAEKSRPRRKFAGLADDSELYALLSFVPLCTRGSVIKFLVELSEDLLTDDREQVAAVLIGLFRAASEAHRARTLANYEPVVLAEAARYAAYSANLVLLAVAVKRELTGSGLVGEQADVASVWNKHALLWRSQMQYSSWNALVETLEVDRSWQDGQRRLVVRLADDPTKVPQVELLWTELVQKSSRGSLVNFGESLESFVRTAWFANDVFSDLTTHALRPLIEAIPGALSKVFITSLGRPMSGANALLTLLLAETKTAQDVVECASALYYTRCPENLIFAALDVAFEQVAPAELGDLSARPQFWVLLCQRIGKGGDDSALIELLRRSWNSGKAYREIPGHVLDAWLRMAERSVQPDRLSPSLFQVLEGIDLEKLSRTRPDLIKRARNAVAELGQSDTITWPR